MAAGAGAGAFMGPGGVVAVEAGLLAYTLYDVVDELKKELTGSGLFDGFDIASVFPSMDSINEGFDSVLEKFASFGNGVASSITGITGPLPGPGGESYSAQPTSVPRKSQSTDIGAGAQDFDALKGVIGQAESDAAGGYNAVVSNKKTPKPPTEMTVGEVLQWQREELADPKNSDRIDVTAIGKYQIINKTLKGLVDGAGVSMSDKFDAETQDKLYMELLKGAGLNDYMDGTISKAEFAHNISKVWAGLPKDEGGKSYYGKDGFNKAHVSWEAVIKAIPDREYVQALINSREEAKVTASEQAAVAVTPENQTPVILSAEEVNKLSADLQKHGDNKAKAAQMQAQYNTPVLKGAGAAVNNQSNPQPARSQESSFSLLQTVEKMLGY
jgi:muramidase (phage lysozyme)